MHVFERSTSYILTMERPDNSIDLFEFSQKYGSMPEAPAKIVFGKIVQTCKDLAAINIFHRDIKGWFDILHYRFANSGFQIWIVPL